MTHKLFGKTLAVGVGAVAMTIAATASTASAETVLTVASWAGPKHTMNYGVFPWLNDKIKACAGSDMSLKVEYGLAPPPAMYDTVRDGVADMTWIVHGYTPGKFVTTKLAELPGLAGSAADVSAAYQETHEKYLAGANEAKGVVVLANYVHGPGMLHTSTPISSYKDIAGMKLRVGGGVANAIGTALDVAGVNVPAPAVYETIASGVADGVFFPMETMYAFKVAEIAKYSFRNPDGMYTTSFGLLMNADTYDGLSAANKKCIDDIKGVKLAREIGEFWDAADALGLEKGLEVGLVVTDASDAERAYFKEKTSGIEADVLAAIDAAGVDGKAALAFFKSKL
ncbi:TRAP transporter substrate-binding protein [Alphaproteobacteria bacterium]|nr:TRAP transporter substrate-binding protein [Alphaproteobacteria bacterium]